MQRAANVHTDGNAYGCSAGSYFVGRTILGDFFDQHGSESREKALKAASNHFPGFVNMVRPILAGADHLLGTASDGHFYFCGAGSPWAILVIVRTAEDRHAVLIPVFENVEASAYFVRFLDAPTSELAVRLAQWKEGRFEVSPRIDRFQWPPANYSDDSGTD